MNRFRASNRAEFQLFRTHSPLYSKLFRYRLPRSAWHSYEESLRAVFVTRRRWHWMRLASALVPWRRRRTRIDSHGFAQRTQTVAADLENGRAPATLELSLLYTRLHDLL